jgi:hypothetical protein
MVMNNTSFGVVVSACRITGAAGVGCCAEAVTLNKNSTAAAEPRISLSLRMNPYLHCGGWPTGSPNAVVTAILQPWGVLTKTLSDTPLLVVSCCVTV